MVEATIKLFVLIHVCICGKLCDESGQMILSCNSTFANLSSMQLIELLILCFVYVTGIGWGVQEIVLWE